MGLVAAAAALIAAGVLYQLVGTARGRRRFGPPGVLIDVGGHRLHVVTRGSGRPLVLLESGIAASSLSWSAVQPAIASFTRTCAYDRAGLGWSEPASSPRSFARMVDELALVIDRIASGERVVLVGHSFGCFIVRAYAARRPERVGGLVLVDPAVEWLEQPTQRRARMLRGGRQLARLGALLARVGVVRLSLALLTGGVPAAPRQFVRVFGPTAARTLERLVGEVRKLPADVHPIVQTLWCQPKCFHAMADHLEALERDRSEIAAFTIARRIPVTVISSADQSPEQIAAQRALAGKSDRARHITAAKSAHWIQFDEPELVVAAVHELIDSPTH